MSSQIQPTAIYSLSPLERCPLEVLERVVLSAAEEQLPGPPSSLLPLLLTSKAVNFALSPERNNSLYASLFALKFDTAAASRRLTIRWLTSRCLSSELRSRFGALNRIRRGAIDDPMLPYDLWTVFLILLEHDHKNALQLTEWARVHTFVLRVAERWLAGGYGPEFTENVGGLVCRIFWELVREADLTEPERRKLQENLYIHLVAGHRLSLFYASEEFFAPKRHPEELEGRIRGHPPASTQVQYYGHTIVIAAPPLASTCLSAFMLAIQPNAIRYTPGFMGEYIRGRTFSERMDEEWNRLIMCCSITSVPIGLGGRRFSPSSLIGSWSGNILVPHLVQFNTFLLSNQNPDALRTPMNFLVAEMQLREHHCLGNKVELMPAPGPDEIADDPLNAWIPRGTIFVEENDTLTAYDPIENRTTVYDTYRTDARHPYVSGYDPETHWFEETDSSEEDSEEPEAEVVESEPGSSDEADPLEEESEEPEAEIVDNKPGPSDETHGLPDDPEYVDEGDQWHDTAEYRYSGIRDIIVTGTMRSADQEHQLEGRVRGWDGLIILLRVPNPGDSPDINLVYRGYIHGERHMVGRWKQTSTPFGEIGWEGGFIFRKDQ